MHKAWKLRHFRHFNQQPSIPDHLNWPLWKSPSFWALKKRTWIPESSFGYLYAQNIRPAPSPLRIFGNTVAKTFPHHHFPPLHHSAWSTDNWYQLHRGSLTSWSRSTLFPHNKLLSLVAIPYTVVWPTCDKWGFQRIFDLLTNIFIFLIARQNSPGWPYTATQEKRVI